MSVKQLMPLNKAIEDNFFTIGRYWGNLNYSLSDYGIVSAMNTGIAVADLNWIWNSKPLTNKDAKIMKQIKQRYKKKNLPFWWWVYPCGQSIKTKEILQTEGFNYLESIPCLAVDVTSMPLAIQKSEEIDISFVKNERELKAWEDISFEGFAMPHDKRNKYKEFVESFDLNENSPQKLFLACWKGQPVATALLFMHNNTAGIYFVTTLPAHRKKGIALALMLESMKYGKISGNKYCVLQSSKEGLALYLKAGFKEYCRADVYCLTD